ncbi:MAG: 3-deoxy-D-manno-octulosonic acid transferase [Cyclobacteriaceae bacterium]|nr:3-deoxy-D-manno-octulosonic acid transferase [Cyclobacteriaceae bacterium]
MESLLYDLGIHVLRATYGVAAWFHPKAKLFREGRETQRKQLRETFPLPNVAPLVWFHCASLGEFEQGRPVIEALKARQPRVRILLTFFSPSGYEVRKNYPGADYVLYLPWDTRNNAEWFVNQVRPAVAVFVKYEFWFHFSESLRKHRIPLISISAIFRPDQVYFKSHGGLFRKTLRNFSWFFVQNETSIELLKGLGISSVTLAGDTRFDRVAIVAEQKEEIAAARDFKSSQKLMVIGSAWPDDMAVLMPFMNAHKDNMKFIVAPHEISDSMLTSLEKNFQGRTVRYSQSGDQDLHDSHLLLVDTIGMLSRLYRYGEYAFVGGGYKEGLHNILEAAAFGIPVFFGSKAPYGKYQEAVDLTAAGGAFAVADTTELTQAYEALDQDGSAYERAARTCGEYVQKNRGATERITQHLLQTLQAWKGE